MALVARYRFAGEIMFGVVNGHAVSQVGKAGIRSGADLNREGIAALADLDDLALHTDATVSLDEVELVTPVPHPSKIICVGANYRAHAAEQALPVPPFPNVFAKLANSLTNPFRPIVIPNDDPTIDYEGELCVVIGKRTRHIKEKDAPNVIAGFTIANDVSARETQLRVSQWIVGKSFDTFCPIGPWLATPASIPDPHALKIETRIGAETVQKASTAEMVYGVTVLIEYLSQAMTLEPGDLILTGTPEGVGHVRTPPRYLRPGDTVTVEVERIGKLTNPVVAEET
jgi:2-keto-4-pentenoate hydratase/2-oxohepta-3-ene-1,7-dioic acid hydratase in catechol pathway